MGTLIFTCSFQYSKTKNNLDEISQLFTFSHALCEQAVLVHWLAAEENKIEREE